MITFEVFGTVLIVVAAAYAAASLYVRQASRSYAIAEAILPRMFECLSKVADAGVPVGVARVAYTLAGTAGCGCYVRGVLLTHYLPLSLVRLVVGGRSPDPVIEHDLFDLDKLDANQRSDFAELVFTVITYDGYANPLSGWVFRRALKTFVSRPFTDRREAELTTVSILSRKQSQRSAEFAEYCPT